MVELFVSSWRKTAGPGHSPRELYLPLSCTAHSPRGLGGEQDRNLCPHGMDEGTHPRSRRSSKEQPGQGAGPLRAASKTISVKVTPGPATSELSRRDPSTPAGTYYLVLNSTLVCDLGRVT